MITRRHLSALPYEALYTLKKRLEAKFEQRPQNYVFTKTNHWMRLSRIQGRCSVEINRRSFSPWREEYVHTN